MRGGAVVAAPRAAPGGAPINAKARAASLADASIAATGPASSPPGATLFQCAPPSRVSWIRPLFVPAQNVFASLGENASELIARPPARPPLRLVASGSPSSLPPAVRSGLTVSQ